MIDLFTLVRLPAEEPVEMIYRSHGSRLPLLLSVPFLCLVLPWFFVFDLTGIAWIAVALSWVVGILGFWYALDVWSSSLVVITSKRLIGVRRGWFGRVRVCEASAHELASMEWKRYRLFPWLGVLRWKNAKGETVHTLGWMRSPHVERDVSRFHLLVRLIFAKKAMLKQVSVCLDKSHKIE